MSEIPIKEATKSNILKLFGIYLSTCHNERYEILEQFSFAQIFEKKMLRPSFIQDVLREMSKFNYHQKLVTKIIKFKLYSKKRKIILWIKSYQ